MPDPPALTKHHPSSVDLELVKRLLRATTAKTLAAFLQKEFDRVDKSLAGGGEAAGAGGGGGGGGGGGRARGGGQELAEQVHSAARCATAWRGAFPPPPP